MRANFIKVNPSGNTTVLILDPFPREIHPKVALQVMKSTSLGAEQVGFIERATIPGAIARLQMMGGEFCGNASRGFAAWLADRQFPGIYPKQGSKGLVIPMEVSGCNGILNVTVISDISKKETKRVEISMPVPLWIKEMSVRESDECFTLVAFEGIVHAVVWNLAPSEDQFKIIQTEVSNELGKEACFGVMFYEESTEFLTPVVYVRDVNSLVWESSCGSGTVAVAAALAERAKNSIESLKLSQPGGIIEVSVRWGKNVLEAKISGDVTIEAEGVVHLDV